MCIRDSIDLNGASNVQVLEAAVADQNGLADFDLGNNSLTCLLYTSVLSMHDIQHVHYPEFLSRARRISRPITYGLSAQYANYFQASSDFIKNDILDHFRLIAPERVEVIPEGVNVADFAAPRDTRSLRLRYGLTERFLFYPAQLWPHKNHLRLLKALKKNGLRGHKIPLVMTGAPFGAASDVLGFLQDQDMDYVCLLYTSRCV